MITKVISGGQTGVDRGALKAACDLGIPTGGFAPKYWLTENGPDPNGLKFYGLTEYLLSGYPARTRANIEAAHATLILTDRLPITGGTLLAYNHALKIGEKRGIGLYVAPFLESGDWSGSIVEWLRECLASKPLLGGEPGHFILNVAGPRESKHPGIAAKAEAFMSGVLRSVNVLAQ